ncbi:hypothetical protein TUMSATVNIG1_27690 [Vibrio nigripulchritudo]|nr:hypothetical protein VNTUMSATTG_27410 [Vibrio nigripulchritudo]BDU32160.1 hypothetical protein TUMSATVNIG1_27690 [Vibrio nigripulchritudo]
MLPTPALSTSPYGTSRNLPMKVLIIEDCPTTQLAMTRMLVKIGLKENNITFSSNAEKGIWLISQREFDLVFIDQNLGQGSTGLDLLEAVRIQNLLPDTTTLIALSSDSTRYVKESFLDLGVHQIERKPILIDRLDRIVSEHYQFKKALNTVLTSYKQSGIKVAASGLKLAKTRTHILRITLILANKLKERGLFKLASNLCQKVNMQLKNPELSATIHDLNFEHISPKESFELVSQEAERIELPQEVADVYSKMLLQQKHIQPLSKSLQNNLDKYPTSLIRLMQNVWLHLVDPDCPQRQAKIAQSFEKIAPTSIALDSDIKMLILWALEQSNQGGINTIKEQWAKFPTKTKRLELEKSIFELLALWDQANQSENKLMDEILDIQNRVERMAGQAFSLPRAILLLDTGRRLEMDEFTQQMLQNAMGLAAKENSLLSRSLIHTSIKHLQGSKNQQSLHQPHENSLSLMGD